MQIERSSDIELVIKFVTPLITFIGILVGVWQFNKGQRNIQEKELEQRRFEAYAKFKELQSIKYDEATKIISNIIHAKDYQSSEFKSSLKRFWQLFWVELSAVEDLQVEIAMKRLGEIVLKSLKKEVLKMFQAKKKMTSRTWVMMLPKQLNNHLEIGIYLKIVNEQKRSKRTFGRIF